MTAPEATRESPMPPPATSSIAISDGETTWTAKVDHMFANDLAPTAPIADRHERVRVAECSVAESVLDDRVGRASSVTGAASACESDTVHDPSIAISQQYVTATIAGATGDHVQLTGERDVNPTSTGNGPSVPDEDRRALSRLVRVTAHSISAGGAGACACRAARSRISMRSAGYPRRVVRSSSRERRRPGPAPEPRGAGRRSA